MEDRRCGLRCLGTITDYRGVAQKLRIRVACCLSPGCSEYVRPGKSALFVGKRTVRWRPYLAAFKLQPRTSRGIIREGRRQNGSVNQAAKLSHKVCTGTRPRKSSPSFMEVVREPGRATAGRKASNVLSSPAKTGLICGMFRRNGRIGTT